MPQPCISHILVGVDHKWILKFVTIIIQFISVPLILLTFLCKKTKTVQRVKSQNKMNKPEIKQTWFDSRPNMLICSYPITPVWRILQILNWLLCKVLLQIKKSVYCCLIYLQLACFSRKIRDWLLLCLLWVEKPFARELEVSFLVTNIITTSHLGWNNFYFNYTLSSLFPSWWPSLTQLNLCTLYRNRSIVSLW